MQFQVDASPSGLSTCLLQDSHPITYAPRFMTSAKVNYKEIEKGMLVITFACNKYHPYSCGKQVDINTDHHLLQTLMQKPHCQSFTETTQNGDMPPEVLPASHLCTRQEPVVPDMLLWLCTNEQSSKEDLEIAKDMEVMRCSSMTHLPVS